MIVLYIRNSNLKKKQMTIKNKKNVLQILNTGDFQVLF